MQRYNRSLCRGRTMIYKDGIWAEERICDLPPDKQNEIRTDLERAYQFFGYRGKLREQMVAKAMDSDLGAVCNLIGLYKWALDNEQKGIEK